MPPARSCHKTPSTSHFSFILLRLFDLFFPLEPRLTCDAHHVISPKMPLSRQLCALDHAARPPFHFEVENNSLQTPFPGASFIPRDINGVTQVNNGAVINDVGEQAKQTEQLAEKMLPRVYALLSRRNIIPNAVQSRC